MLVRHDFVRSRSRACAHPTPIRPHPGTIDLGGCGFADASARSPAGVGVAPFPWTVAGSILKSSRGIDAGPGFGRRTAVRPQVPRQAHVLSHCPAHALHVAGVSHSPTASPTPARRGFDRQIAGRLPKPAKASDLPCSEARRWQLSWGRTCSVSPPTRCSRRFSSPGFSSTAEPPPAVTPRGRRRARSAAIPTARPRTTLPRDAADRSPSRG